MNCVPDSLLRSLTLELSSLLLQSHVVEIIILGRLKKHERQLQIFSEATSELIDHALFIRNVLFSEASKFLKLDVVLIHRHVSLLEIAELLTLALNNTLWNVVRFEVPTEVSPSDHTTSSGIFVLLIPISSLVLELKRSELDIVLRPDIAAFKMLVDIHEPIISSVASTQ